MEGPDQGAHTLLAGLFGYALLGLSVLLCPTRKAPRQKAVPQLPPCSSGERGDCGPHIACIPALPPAVRAAAAVLLTAPRNRLPSRSTVRSAQVNGRDINLGRHKDEVAAAKSYDRAAICARGVDNAKLNFPIEDYHDEVAELSATPLDDLAASLRGVEERMQAQTSR